MAYDLTGFLADPYQNRNGIVPICREFGVDPSVADNSVPINRALASLGPLGLVAIIERPGVYPIQNPIVIGDGSATAQATWVAQLEGVGMPGWLGGTYVPGPRTELKWTGASGGSMITIQGGCSGAAVRKLFLNGNSLAARPLSVLGGMFGEYKHVYSSNTYDGVLLQPNAGASGSGIRNAMHNIFDGIGVAILGYPSGQTSTKCAGVALMDNGQDSGVNCCFNDFRHIWLSLPNTSIGNQYSAIYLQGCDSNWFTFVHPLYTAGGTDTQFSVTLDYGGLNSGWPEGNSITGIDTQKTARNIGVPSGTPGNWIAGHSPANGGYVTNPALTGLQWGYSGTV